MNIRPRLWTLTLIALLVSTAGAAWAGSPGESGFLTLRYPVGAREAAMGGAGVAGSTGAAAMYWNPARAAFEEHGTSLLLQHQRSFGVSDREAATLAHRSGMGVLGVVFSGWYSDDIDRTTEDEAGVPVGVFAPHQVAMGVTYARKLNDKLAVGAAVKLLHEKIDTDDGTGFAYDVYISHKALVEGLWFGASFTNFGPDMTVREAPYPLPAAFRMGIAWDPQMEILAGRMTVLADMVFPNDGNEKAHVGAEYRLVPALALRVGHKVNYESQGLTFGAGFTRGNIDVGYAYEDSLNDLDPQHRFAVEFGFGPES